eukprot:1228178-Pyramimonas_sp.AAC.1
MSGRIPQLRYYATCFQYSCTAGYTMCSTPTTAKLAFAGEEASQTTVLHDLTLQETAEEWYIFLWVATIGCTKLSDTVAHENAFGRYLEMPEV